jgi:acyl-CoA thioester hydrolase
MLTNTAALRENHDGAPKYQTRLRVRYAETDQMGVVYHANYLVWMEIGRVELVRSRGFNYKDLEEVEGLLLSVVEVKGRYLSPARYDDEVVVETWLADSNPRIIEFGYEIRLANEDRPLFRGSTRHVWLNRQFRPVRLPEKYFQWLKAGRVD